MIDTDKYENHTPERWTVDEEDPCRVIDVQDCTIARTDFLDLGDIDDEREWQLTNAQLIADAPLLLAEVKRLQRYEREHKELWDIIANFSPKDSEEDDDIHEQWLESVSQGYMGSVYDYVMMKQEEMIYE